MKTLKASKHDLIVQALKAHVGNQRKAAQALGIPKSTLNDYCTRHNWDLSAFKMRKPLSPMEKRMKLVGRLMKIYGRAHELPEEDLMHKFLTDLRYWCVENNYHYRSADARAEVVYLNEIQGATNESETLQQTITKGTGIDSGRLPAGK